MKIQVIKKGNEQGQDDEQLPVCRGRSAGGSEEVGVPTFHHKTLGFWAEVPI